MTLRDIVQGNDTAAGRAFDGAVMLLIVYLLLTFSIGTLPNLTVEEAAFLNASDYVVFGLFTIEYALRNRDRAQQAEILGQLLRGPGPARAGPVLRDRSIGLGRRTGA